MARGRSESKIKENVVKQETVTKKPKKEKETGSRRRKSERDGKEVNTPQGKKTPTARRRKGSVAEGAAGKNQTAGNS